MDYVNEVQEIATTGDILKTILLIHSGENTSEIFRDVALYSKRRLKFETKRILDYLLTENADINVRDVGGWTPLMQAVLRDNLDLVRYLLVNKADTNLTNDNGMTALHIAVEHESLSVIEVLISHGASVDPQDVIGQTPLMYALAYENEEVVEYLLENKPNVSIVDIKGETAWDFCKNKGTDKWENMLREHISA